jgi:hypothetical protein
MRALPCFSVPFGLSESAARFDYLKPQSGKNTEKRKAEDTPIAAIESERVYANHRKWACASGLSD